MTAKGETHDRIKGLELGADDYLGKPFEPKELILRIKNILNKIQKPALSDKVYIGNTLIDLKKLNIKINNKIKKINPQEKKVLEKMLESPGKVFSRDDIGKVINISKDSEEKRIILPAIKSLKKMKIKIDGPLSADTSFFFDKKNKPDVIVGMYHDQVLTPIKTIMGFKAINITLGLPFIRVSPDHGVAADIVGKKVADPSSLIESIKFFNNIQ